MVLSQVLFLNEHPLSILICFYGTLDAVIGYMLYSSGNVDVYLWFYVTILCWRFPISWIASNMLANWMSCSPLYFYNLCYTNLLVRHLSLYLFSILDKFFLILLISWQIYLISNLISSEDLTFLSFSSLIFKSTSHNRCSFSSILQTLSESEL